MLNTFLELLTKTLFELELSSELPFLTLSPVVGGSNDELIVTIFVFKCFYCTLLRYCRETNLCFKIGFKESVFILLRLYSVPPSMFAVRLTFSGL